MPKKCYFPQKCDKNHIFDKFLTGKIRPINIKDVKQNLIN